MLAVFLSALGFSLALIGASASGLLEHLQADGEAGGDGHGDTHHGDGHGFLSGLLSLRFLTWGLGGFGATGSLLSLLDVSAVAQLPAAVFVGGLVGGGTTVLFRRLRAAGAGTVPEADLLLGHEGIVSVALKPGGLGKVRLRVNEQDLELLARAGEDESLPKESRVVIVRFRDDVAEVRQAPWED